MALLFTGLLGTAAVIIAYSGYYYGYEYFARSAERVIDSEIYYLDQANREGNLPQALERAMLRSDRLYAIMDRDGSIKKGNLSSFPEAHETTNTDMVLFTRGNLTYGAKIHSLSEESRLIVAVDVTEMISVGQIVRVLGVITIILMGIVILTSFLISTFVVSRTNRIALTAKKIMDTGDLSRRIEVDGRWDDLSHMAGVLNALLSRIETLLIGIRRVSDNIAHDLRTPLTRLRNNLEELRTTAGDDNPRRSSYEALIAEADRILSTFHALLRIARIETAKQKNQFRFMDLVKVLRDVLELYEPLAEEKNIKLQARLPDEHSYYGDPDLLFQAVANLIDNSIKFTPPGGLITLALEIDINTRIIVTDSGSGIAPQDQEKVFDRFYRAEASRTTPGNGLGLSLVAAVIDLHDGVIKLQNRDPGLEISIQL